MNLQEAIERFAAEHGVPIPDDPEAEAARLAALGYRRTSNKYGLLARVDRPDWRPFMDEQGYWGGNADQYRRVHSQDCIQVHFLVSKHVPSSSGDDTGYISQA